ncbi:MAG: alpha/beta fold hydrolase [Sphingobium sp.]
MLIGAPYAPIWKLENLDDDGWRAIADEFSAAQLPKIIETRKALGVSIEPVVIGGVKGFMLTPRAVDRRHRNQLILHFHGGGWVFGGGEAGTSAAALLAAFGGYKVLSVDYRMPPDHPFPAAVDDALAVYKAVITKTAPRRIAVNGVSAGSNVLLALMLRLKEERLPMPGAIAPGSPAADLTKTGDSFYTNEWVDNVLVSYDAYFVNVAKLYANGRDLKDPLLSPVYGDLHGFPPTILTTGTRDLFLSSTVRLHRKLRQAGVVAELQLFEGISHSQYLSNPQAPITKEANQEITSFFDAHLAP